MQLYYQPYEHQITLEDLKKNIIRSYPINTLAAGTGQEITNFEVKWLNYKADQQGLFEITGLEAK